jgi:hypothetical protein
MASAWDKRNAKARKLGYKNYYDYRKHGYGKDPPAEQPTRRSPRGKAAFKRQLRKPDQVALIVEVPEAHTPDGTWTKMRFIVTRRDGQIDEYVVPLDDEEDLDWWHAGFQDLDIEYFEYATKTQKGYTGVKLRRRRRQKRQW